MAEVTPPLFQTIDGEYTGAHLGLPYRNLTTEGIADAGSLAVSQRAAGANMSVDVAAGAAWVLGDDLAASQPCYRVYNNATVNLAIAAADGTNPRIDRVVAEVRDAAFSGVSTDWRLRVITGTPAGSPSAPAEPNNCLTLATVSVPAGDTTISTAQITDARVRAMPAHGAGGRLGYATATADEAITGEESLPGLTATVRVPAGRLIKVSASVNIQHAPNIGTPQVGRAFLALKEGSTYLGGSDWSAQPDGGNSTQINHSPFVLLTPSAGTHTYFASIWHISGNGLFTMKASATLPATFLVEDLGPAS